MLKELSMESLAETKLAAMFDEAVRIVNESFEKDTDVQGKRSIVLRIDFKPNEHGYVDAEMSVHASTPKRKVKSLASFDEGVLKIDTISNDARQPSLMDQEEMGKVVKIKEGGISNG